MHSGCCHNSTHKSVPWGKWGNKQQRNNVNAQVSCDLPDRGQDRRKVGYPGCPRGKKNYRVFTNYSRARKRMDGEDIFGSKIKVQFSIPGQDSGVSGSQNWANTSRKGKYNEILTLFALRMAKTPF